MNTSLEGLDRQGLLDYIDSLEAKTAALEEKMEDLKAQVDVLNMDMDEFKVPEVSDVPELKVSEQTEEILSEASLLFGDDYVAEPAPVENGVVKLDPVDREESYIPVAPKKEPAPKKALKVKVKKKR